MAKNWQHLVETAPTRPYQRTAKDKARLLARYVPNKAFKTGTPPTYLYTSGNLNRCNPSGVACVYFGEGPEVARTEFDSYYTKPLAELGYYARTQLKHIIDLGDLAARNHFHLKAEDFSRSYAPKSGELIPLQEIGRAVSKQKKITATRFPSNAMRKKGKSGFNLVFFQDIVEGADYLKIMENDTAVESWPK